MAVGSVRGDTFSGFGGWDTESDDDDFFVPTNLNPSQERRLASRQKYGSKQLCDWSIKQRDLYDRLKKSLANSASEKTLKKKLDVSEYVKLPRELRDSLTEVLSDLQKVLGLKNPPKTSTKLQGIKEELETLKCNVDAEESASSTEESDDESLFSDLSDTNSIYNEEPNDQLPSSDITPAPTQSKGHIVSKINTIVNSKSLKIALGVMSTLGMIYYMGLPSDELAQKAGYEEGESQAIHQINHAVSFVARFSQTTIQQTFNDILNVLINKR